MRNLFILIFFVIISTSNLFAVDELDINEKKKYQNIKPKVITYNGQELFTEMTYDVGLENYWTKKAVKEERIKYDVVASNHCKKINRKAHFRGYGKIKRDDSPAELVFDGVFTVLSLGLIHTPGAMWKLKSLSYVCDLKEDPILVAENKKLQLAKLKKEEKEKREFDELLNEIPLLEDYDLCDKAYNENGIIPFSFIGNKSTRGLFEEEMLARNLRPDECRKMTGKFTNEEKNEMKKIANEQKKIVAAQKAEEEKIMQRIARRNELKTDCIDLGFKENTEGMGNCVLKLMEIESKNQQAQIINQENEILEKEKLAVEIAKLEQLIKQAEAAEQAAIAAQQQAKATEAANRSQRFNKALDDIRHWSCYYGNAWDCR